MDSGGGKPKLLPPRLGDPLTSLRNLLVGLLVLAVLVMLFARFIPQHHNRVLRQIEDWITTVAMTGFDLAALLWPILLVLPYRRTNALYLRAFANDASTGDLRLALQRELGRGVRLSGIRDPRRRSSLFLRSVTVFVFCFRYSTVRHMNLEAGADWLPRLWRSLGDARCVFIDMSDLTGNVRAEMQLAHKRVGASRMMFLGSVGIKVEALRTFVVAALGLQESGVHGPHVAIWESTEGPARDQFLDAVRRFVAELPDTAANSARDPAKPLSDQPAWTPESRIRRTRLALTEIAGLAFIPVCLTLYQVGFWLLFPFGNETNPLSHRARFYVETFAHAFHWFLVAMFVYICYAVMRYFLECGSPAGRVKSVLILGFYSVLFWLVATAN